MANLRTAMDATFWDLNISTTKTLDGIARSIPGEPIPLDVNKASRALRIQQLAIIGQGFPLGLVPTYSPISSHKEFGSFAFQSSFCRIATSKWWLGFIGQLRPKKLVANLKTEISKVEKWELPVLKEMFLLKRPELKDIGKQFLEKSYYDLGIYSQLALTPYSSLLLSTEKDGVKKERRLRAMLFHKLPDHDITFEAAWPELFIDHKGKYWEVPESISLDCLSLVSEDGLRYRFGLHKNTGHPQAVDNITDEPPLNLMQGLCGKAAFSYEKSIDLWRIREDVTKRYKPVKKGYQYVPPYDERLVEPHETISGIIGGTFESWLSRDRRWPFAVDLFGSLCYSYQHGKFIKDYKDLTRIDARLDVSSVSAIAKQVSKVFRKGSSDSRRDNPCSPRLELILQQQVAGPIVFRVDTRFSLGSSSGGPGVKMDDFIMSLNYSLKILHSGKVVAWYSPKRKEGMIELRVFEF